MTLLGTKVAPTITADQLESFDAPPGVTIVSFKSKEVTAFCPITGQPDLYTVRITYSVYKKCIESKALKLYLNSFRDRGIFAEGLAAEIADAIWAAIDPVNVTVKVTQQKRGGLVLVAVAER